MQTAPTRSGRSRDGRRVVVLLVPEVHLLDLAGPVQVFYEAALLGGSYAVSHHAETETLRTAQGLWLSRLEPLPEPTAGDLVLVPGLWSGALERLRAPVAWLRSAHEAGATIASICSGAFVVARSGLLDGRRCTTHWKLVQRLREAAPRAEVLENRLYVGDGRVVTSAGEAAGIDLALSLVERDHGPLVVSRVAREMVVYLRRSGEHGQGSVYLDHRTHLHPGVHRVQDWIVEHPEDRHALSRLARLAGMSERNLTRVFARATGVSLKVFAHKVKLQVARDLAADPQRTAESIARSCGFEDGRQLRRLWRRSFGMPLSQFRAALPPADAGGRS